MNILPKKSWHVRTKANIERVRKDEAQAADEEKERQRKIALAESEARTDLLRERSRKRKRSESDAEIASTDVASGGTPSVGLTDFTSAGTSVVSLTGENKHINFFQDLEDGIKGKGTNPEYEKEKKDEKEKQERAIGLLTYLGQSAVEAQAEKPWYFKAPEKKRKITEEDNLTSTADKKKEEYEARKKRKMDPLCGMMGYLTQTRKVNERRSGDGTHEKERSRHGHKHKPKKSTDVQPSKTREQMRAERLRREQEERAKTEKLLAKLRGEKVAGEEEVVVDERQMGYNSQFNPMFVRKRKSR